MPRELTDTVQSLTPDRKLRNTHIAIENPTRSTSLTSPGVELAVTAEAPSTSVARLLRVVLADLVSATASTAELVEDVRFATTGATVGDDVLTHRA